LKKKIGNRTDGCGRLMKIAAVSLGIFGAACFLPSS
jgi:hypothetical protein